MRHDVIVVGARCAGATLATLLARSGVKTLVLDANSLPCDMPMSTHYIHPPGLDVLDELGVGDAVRRVTPASRRLHYQVEQHHVFAAYPDERSAYCVRRSTLDVLLQQSAASAGADVRSGARVIDLIRNDERVCGVVVQTSNGRERISADLVVGADGRNSTVAKLAGAEEYLTVPMTRSGYWFYFPTPTLWRKDERYADWEAYIGWEGDGLRYIFQCDGDLLLLAASPPNAEARTWGANYRACTLEYFRRSSITGPLVEAAEPIGRGMGLLKAHFYYRRAVGPGFALVGDAGTFKDFVTGHGMTDAFKGAQRLHAAILAGGDDALLRYWRERDVETLPLYLDAIRLGGVEFNNPFNRLLFEHLARDPAWAERLPAVADRRISPFRAFRRDELMHMVAGALLRGRFDVLPSFLAARKRIGASLLELKRRQTLLDALQNAPEPMLDPALGGAAAARLAAGG